MTITPSSDVAVLHQGGLPAEQRIADPIVLFLANELFPMMTAFWPASANQLDSNASATALAWALMIKGFPVGQVREAVLQLAEDADRQFAPRPAEVKAAILRRMPAVKVASVGCELSMRACEMQAVARVYEREHRVIDSLVQAELIHLLAELRQRGVTVTGGMM
ncbi:hypothetical protein [Aeromonas veronii]